MAVHPSSSPAAPRSSWRSALRGLWRNRWPQWQRRRALARPLALALLVCVGAWVFLELADAVREGEEMALDRVLLLALRNPADLSDPLGPRWFELVMTDLTALGGGTVLTVLTLATLGYLLLLRKWGTALMVACSVGGGALASQLLKLLIERPRPDLVPHGVQVLTLSFPSGHATMSASVYLTLGVLLASLQGSRRAAVYLLLVAGLLTLAIGISRVYLGVHWPSDVLAGWSLGAAWALLCLMVSLWLRDRSGQALPALHEEA